MLPQARHGYSPRFDEALVLASIVHWPKDRKGTTVPYIIHPVHVASIAARHGYEEDVQIAALLHDVLEDVEPRHQQMRQRLAQTFRELPEDVEDAATFKFMLADFIARRFDPRVLSLVQSMTQQKKRPNGDSIPIEERHAEAVRKLAECGDLELVALKASDALHNARSIEQDLRAKGLEMMSRFKGSPDETVKYYGEVARVVAKKLGAHPLAAELTGAVDELMRTLAEQLEAEQASLKSVVEALQRLRRQQA